MTGLHETCTIRCLIAVYAGGLSYRKDLSQEQIAESSNTIQREAEASVQDLRQVLRSLRFDDRIDPRASTEDTRITRPRGWQEGRGWL